MSKSVFCIAATAALLLAAPAATAKGHLVGGAVGAAVAPKHHRVAGAVVGGAVGHHMAKTKAAKQAAPAK